MNALPRAIVKMKQPAIKALHRLMQNLDCFFMSQPRLSESLPEWISGKLFKPHIGTKYSVQVKERGSPGALIDVQITKGAALVKKSKGKCTYCGLSFKKYPGLLTVDHLVPEHHFKELNQSGEKVSAKGNYDDNLVAACIACNLLKSNWPIGVSNNWQRWMQTAGRTDYIKAAWKYVKRLRTTTDDKALKKFMKKL